MAETINTETPASVVTESQAQQPKTAPATSRKSGKWFSSLGAAFTVAAWILLVFSGNASIACGVAGLLLSCLGIHKMSRGWRDLSTTSIIASSVLLVVFAIFFFGIRVVVNSL